MSGLFSVHCDVCIFLSVLVSLPQLKSHLLLYCRPAFICVCAADINVFVEVEPRRAKTNRLFLSPFFLLYRLGDHGGNITRRKVSNLHIHVCCRGWKSLRTMANVLARRTPKGKREHNI